MSDDEIEQPPMQTNGVIPGKQFRAGSKKSQEKLAELGFDPITKMVQLYERLTKEDQYWEMMKGKSNNVQLDAEGKEVKRTRYSSHAHAAVLGQLEKVINNLMRYNYGRVPETVNLNLEKKPGLVVNTTNGEVIKAFGGEVEDGQVIEHVEEVPKIALEVPNASKVRVK